jgi:hypothetical protein
MANQLVNAIANEPNKVFRGLQNSLYKKYRFTVPVYAMAWNDVAHIEYIGTHETQGLLKNPLQTKDQQQVLVEIQSVLITDRQIEKKVIMSTLKTVSLFKNLDTSSSCGITFSL